jgi:hypothetical protein
VALVRCEKHGRPSGRTQRYSIGVKPLGYPHTAALCGRQGCMNAGLAWLTEEEARAYRRGERVFSVPNAAVKIQVD